MDLDVKGLSLNENRAKGKKDINVLLLGETGVGKSTFINAFVNYIHYETFSAAKEGELKTLIPSQIHIVNKDFESIIINIGKDDNEVQKVGASATQDVRAYVFPLGKGNVRIRFIDTPGLGDNRGIKQDGENCERILDYIGQLQELHAICILLKPTNTRLTSWFVYCVKELLSRLEKSASRNIVFIFTNTKGTNYTPGDTLPCLKALLDEIRKQPPYVNIPLVYNITMNNNLFCFDNEAFRGLVAVQHNVELDKSSVEGCIQSWDRSTIEAQRLIRYIMGDGISKDPLMPHQVKNTVCVNEARRIICQLAQPLAEITQLIYDNIRALDRHKEKLECQNQSLDDLKDKLYIPIIDLEVINLPHPATVCTSKECSDTYRVGDRNKYHYKKPCHDHCYLTNVTKELIGDPALIYCAAMQSKETCQQCGCSYSLHMHIYYSTKTIDGKIEDDSIKMAIHEKQNAVRRAEKLVDEMKKRKIELEEERVVVIRTTAQFAHFLQQNAITPFNDAYKKYIEYLIERENSLGKFADLDTIRDLENLKKQYEVIKNAFDNSLKCKDVLDGNVVAEVTAKTIIESLPKLYQLKHNGQKIKQLFNSQRTSRNFEHNKRDYVHNSIIKLSTNENKNNAQKENQQEKKQYKQNENNQQKKKQDFNYKNNNKRFIKGKKQPNVQQQAYNQNRRTEYRSQSQPRYEMNRTMPPPYTQTPSFHDMQYDNRNPMYGPNYPPPHYPPPHYPPPLLQQHNSYQFPYGHQPPSYGPQPSPHGPQPHFYDPLLSYGNQQYSREQSNLEPSNVHVKVEINKKGGGSPERNNSSNCTPQPRNVPPNTPNQNTTTSRESNYSKFVNQQYQHGGNQYGNRGRGRGNRHGYMQNRNRNYSEEQDSDSDRSSKFNTSKPKSESTTEFKQGQCSKDDTNKNIEEQHDGFEFVYDNQNKKGNIKKNEPRFSAPSNSTKNKKKNDVGCPIN